jgi:hypothetical protein
MGPDKIAVMGFGFGQRYLCEPVEDSGILLLNQSGAAPHLGEAAILLAFPPSGRAFQENAEGAPEAEIVLVCEIRDCDAVLCGGRKIPLHQLEHGPMQMPVGD